MKFNGLIRFLTILLVFVSIYQLHFTWVINNHEEKLQQKAEKYVNTIFSDSSISVDLRDEYIKKEYRRLVEETKNEVITYGLTGDVTYSQAKDQELNLGLDLQGGMNVTLEIGINDLIRGLSNNPKDVFLNLALKNTTDKKYSSNMDYISLFHKEYIDVSNNGKLSDLFANSSTLGNRVTSNTSDNQILNIIREETIEAQKRTYNILQTRIDKFGVAQPSVNLDINKSIITVELAGVQDDPERVRRYLQSTANLQFWEIYDIESVYQFIVEAEKAIQDVNQSESSTSNSKKQETSNQEQFSSMEDFLKNTDVADTTSKIGKSNEEEEKSFNAFSNILGQLQYYAQQASQNNTPLNKVALTFSIEDKNINAFIEQVNQEYIKNILPSNLSFLQEKKDTKSESSYTVFHGIRKQEFSDKARLEGESIAVAYQDYDDRGRPCIRMSMTKAGEKIWADMTSQNIEMPIAISLDNIVYSAPRVNSPIIGGNSEISGNFTIEEAQDLSNILKSGKLPAPTKIVLEQLVGPTLGSETIQNGMMAFVISFVIILLLMFVYYSTGGTIANISLLLNLLFTIGVLTALGATLTAPGIAGLVLTIGMAVDTNVIIFERIKEEIRRGASYINAIKNGYSKSLSPVLDAHITTLLTAIILYNFGLGPVKGFATTQILGILLSLFCGILVSRQINDFWTKRKKHLKYFTPLSKKVFPSPNFRFIEFRKYAYILSFIILCLGVGSFFFGFDLGVEFKGGRTYIVKFNNTPNIEILRNTLRENLEGDNPIIKTIGNKNQLSITTAYLIDNDTKEADDEVLKKIYQSSNKYISNDMALASFINYNLVGSQKVLPTISEDLKQGALNATILSLVIVFFYILIRFRKWQYSLGTIVALLHDIFVCLAIFSFLRKVVPFPLEIDQHFIAAILTVIGFSMNDTVIVFDRIREHFRSNKNASQTDIINKAINNTLSRTIMTSLTVFLTILILFIFGGEVTRGFAFAMLIGVVTGTYSSIFVAAPILVDFQKIKLKKA